MNTPTTITNPLTRWFSNVLYLLIVLAIALGLAELQSEHRAGTSQRAAHHRDRANALYARQQRSFYLPGQRVQGTVQADYFFGKPVAGGEQQGFQVTAWGSRMSDAVRREVQVIPNGQEVRHSESDWLRESREVAIEILPQAVPW